MPFTFAHPAYAVPLKVVNPRMFSVTGPVVPPDRPKSVCPSTAMESDEAAGLDRLPSLRSRRISVASIRRCLHAQERVLRATASDPAIGICVGYALIQDHAIRAIGRRFGGTRLRGRTCAPPLDGRASRAAGRDESAETNLLGDGRLGRGPRDGAQAAVRLQRKSRRHPGRRADLRVMRRRAAGLRGLAMEKKDLNEQRRRHCLSCGNACGAVLVSYSAALA